jgi:hypothetical protein
MSFMLVEKHLGLVQVARMEPISDAGRVPAKSLELLRRTAMGDTGGSQAARSFLFGLLVGQEDPTGYRGQGAIELRRLDPLHTRAAMEVLAWWVGGTESDQPVYDVLDQIIDHFQETSGDPKVGAALGKIERAQMLVNDAGEDLCSVDGFSDQWSEVCDLYSAVKDQWHNVNRRRQELQQIEAE